MLNKSRAIVLHHVKYGESSIVVTLYTEKYGRIACMVNGVRSKKSRFPATLFQPLTLLETDFYYRQNRELQRLKEANCLDHYHSIPYSVSKSTVAIFLAEVLYLTLQEEEGNPVLFSYLYHALQILDSKDEGSSTFHHWFMLHLTRYLGFFPPAQLIQEDGMVSADFLAFQSMPAGVSAALRLLANHAQSPPDLKDIPYCDRNELLARVIKYYASHIDGFSRLKSYQVLQEVFKS